MYVQSNVKHPCKPRPASFLQNHYTRQPIFEFPNIHISGRPLIFTATGEQSNSTWICYHNPNRPKSPYFPTYHPIIRTQMVSTEHSLPKIIMHCGGGYLKYSWVYQSQGESFDFVGKCDNDRDNQSLYDIGPLSQRSIPSINFRSIPRKRSQVGIELQGMPQANTF